MTEQTSTTEPPAGGGGDAPWYSGLPDDLKGNASITRYASLEDAGRAIAHYAGHFGVPSDQLLRLPKPDDAEGQGALWNKLGRPEAPDKYGVKLPEGSTLDDGSLQGFLAHMHKAGPFTPDMAKAAVDWYAGFAQQGMAAATEAMKNEGKAAEATLKGEWGAGYQARFDAACATALKFGGAELQSYLDESGLGNDPRMIRAFDKIAEAMQEAGAAPAERGRDTPRALSPAEAKAELARIETDEKIMNALRNSNDGQHAFWVEKRLELIRLAHAS